MEAANLRPAVNNLSVRPHYFQKKKTKLHASSFAVSGLCFWRQPALVARIPKAEKPLGACFLIPLRALNCPQVSTHHKHQSIHYLANLIFFFTQAIQNQHRSSNRASPKQFSCEVVYLCAYNFSLQNYLNQYCNVFKYTPQLLNIFASNYSKCLQICIHVQ